MKYRHTIFSFLLLPQILFCTEKGGTTKSNAQQGKLFSDSYPSQINLDGTINGYRPAFYPDAGIGHFVSVDFLFWQGTVDGFAFAWTFPEAFVTTNGVRGGAIPNGEFHDIDYDWSPGVRLSLGRHLPIDNWDLTVNWTHYKNHCTGNAGINTTIRQSLLALWMPQGFIAGAYNALHARAKWRLNFNTIDLNLGRTSFAVKSLCVNPVLGLRGAFVHQHFQADYTEGLFIFESAQASSVRFVGNNQFNGWGIRPGLETSWHLTKEWSLYANSFISALYGVFSLKENAQLTNNNLANLLNEHDRYYKNAFAIDLALGVKWEVFFTSCKRHLLISAGYEMANWFSQNQLVNFVYVDQAPAFGPYVSGDLGLQGIDISARFDF